MPVDEDEGGDEVGVERVDQPPLKPTHSKWTRLKSEVAFWFIWTRVFVILSGSYSSLLHFYKMERIQNPWR